MGENQENPSILKILIQTKKSPLAITLTGFMGNPF